MNSTCPECGSRIAEGESKCLACLLLGALDERGGDPAVKGGSAVPHRRVGDYEILKLIGVGGSAEVYLARKPEPVGRDVALKLIRPGMGSERVVARFEAEREVLARLQHPNIATIFDAGSSPAGLPYFVMEYVEGLPVTDYVAREQLSLELLLRLFVQICAAVTHAHQRGIVHRDLKPSNVLVDTAGQPKVIDFGIARALGENVGERTLFLTREGEMLGTPAYMSPEQALGQMAEIDTRSDVFSLGVILYELLTGQLPIDLEGASGAGSTELRRILTETEFQRPSLRNTTEHIPNGAIRGDLDWIVMKALEREKERRYGSVAALADDIGRHLADQPVTAGPPTVGYLLRKFIRRNRALAGGSAVAMAALVAGTAISVSQAARAITAQREALASAQQAVVSQKEAEKQARISDGINQFFLDDLLGADLRNRSRTDVTLRELVDTAAAKSDQRFRGEPEVAAEVEMRIGDLYGALAEYDKAEIYYLRSRERSRGLADANLRDAADERLLRSLAINSHRQGRNKDARQYWDEWAALAARIEIPPKLLLLARSQEATMLGNEGREAEGIEKLKELLPDFESQLGPDHSATLTLKVNLGRRLIATGDLAAGVLLLEDYVEKSRGAEITLSFSEALADLGWAYAQQGRLDESKVVFDEAIGIQKQMLVPDHQSLILTLSQLAASYAATGRGHLAEPIYRELFEAGLASDAPLPVESLIAGYSYGVQVLRQSPEKAKPIFKRVVEGFQRLGAGTEQRAFHANFQLAIAEWLTGEKNEAVARLNDVVALGIEHRGESHPDVQGVRKVLMSLEHERGQREATLPYARAALEAPIPTDPRLRQAAIEAIESVLLILEFNFKDRPEMLIEMHRDALAAGYDSVEAWRGLGMALYGRYRGSQQLQDLRLAAVCVLRAGTVNDGAGVKIVSEWIKSDELANGMQTPEFLIGPDSVWHYQEATPADPAWRRGGFDPGGWPTGSGEFGYGDGDEDTLLGFGDDPASKPMSVCFRLELTVEQSYQRPLVATLVHDDGGIVYVDGEEVYRSLMPHGEPTPDTPAANDEVTESIPHGFAIAPERLRTGHPVVIAIQVHQTAHDTSDLSFAFSLAEPLPDFQSALAVIPEADLDAFFGDLKQSLINGPR